MAIRHFFISSSEALTKPSVQGKAGKSRFFLRFIGPYKVTESRLLLGCPESSYFAFFP
jgi:hypothetical protein